MMKLVRRMSLGCLLGCASGALVVVSGCASTGEDSSPDEGGGWDEAGEVVLDPADWPAKAAQSSEGDVIEEVEPYEPPGHVRFTRGEFSEAQGSIGVEVSLEAPPPAGSLLRVYVSVSTELEHWQRSFEFSAEGTDQVLPIDMAALGVRDLKERIGTLAFTVVLEDGDERVVLPRAGGATASGFHLKFHRDRLGRLFAYLPDIKNADYEAEWTKAKIESLALHNAHPFSPGHESDPEEEATASLGDRRIQQSGPSPNIEFCPKMHVEYKDSGLGETWWPETGLKPRPMYGTRYIVLNGSTQVAIGYTDEMDGCASFYLTPGTTYTVQVWAYASIWGNFFSVQSSAGTVRYKSYSLTATSSLVNHSPNLTDTGGQPRWNVYQALIRAGRKHGVGSNNYYLLEYDTTYDPAWSGGQGFVGKDDSAEHKFRIVHEFGHGLQDLINGSTFPSVYTVGEDLDSDGSCDISPTPDVDCRSHTGTSSTDCTATGSHKMWSLEYMSAAANEGWAHFVAADVWNDHANGDCSFSYWRAKSGTGTRPIAVDCATGDTLYPIRYMRNRCDTNSTFYSQGGVEVDWLRAFWDVHTKGTSPPSLSTMLNWMKVTGVTNTNVKSKLDTSANTIGGTLNTNWDATKGTSGDGNGL